MRAYPYPLPEEAIRGFCHPADSHPLATPYRHHDGHLYAGNGWIAVRAYRGAWLDQDFPAASAPIRERFASLPWHHFDLLADSPAWTLLDDHRGAIFRTTGHSMFIDTRQGPRVAPSPVLRLAHHTLRLSFLQAIARLPRAQVYTGTLHGTHLLARFSGGYVILPPHPGLAAPAFSILQPKEDALRRPQTFPTAPRPTFSLPGWPPQVDPDAPVSAS